MPAPIQRHTTLPTCLATLISGDRISEYYGKPINRPAKIAKFVTVGLLTVACTVHPGIAQEVSQDRVSAAFNAVDNHAQIDTVAELEEATEDPDELSTEELAQQLNNPNSPLSSLTLQNITTFYSGDLPDADNQVGNMFLFQPVFPFPLTDDGTRNFYVRPGFSFATNQPVPNATGTGFTHEISLGDIGFDVAVGQSFDSGLIMVGGIQGTIPTFTTLSGEQLRLGPEGLIAFLNKEGAVAAFPQHQWNVAGNGPDYSTSTLELFALKFLSDGWTVGTNPKINYDWQSEQWTVPVNATIRKVVKLGNVPTQFSASFDYYVEKNDNFGPDFGLTFKITPTVPNFIYNAFN
ncbi:hypothetical protein [Roseibium sediminicola]|uniref:Uncharacterized protein n=1 Tax=Roseibium sediminicola TaxID=2933272 RepID=A0ABT0GMJ0_9HYPH|nr:hypothetical protein [Roseibium sp. CAU 1639]MCK7610641.1 hypothetical protein [Roseibium sp. CAU 1639]